MCSQFDLWDMSTSSSLSCIANSCFIAVLQGIGTSASLEAVLSLEQAFASSLLKLQFLDNVLQPLPAGTVMPAKSAVETHSHAKLRWNVMQ